MDLNVLSDQEEELVHLVEVEHNNYLRGEWLLFEHLNELSELVDVLLVDLGVKILNLNDLALKRSNKRIQ